MVCMNGKVVPSRRLIHYLAGNQQTEYQLTPKADVANLAPNARFVPRADSCTAAELRRSAAVYRRCRSFNRAAHTRLMPSVLRFPCNRMSPTCRRRGGLSGRTSVRAIAMGPPLKHILGTTEQPSPTATTLFIGSMLSNSINGFGGDPAGASHSPTVRRSGVPSLRRISGQRERNAGVTFSGTFVISAGRMATSSSSDSEVTSNDGSSTGRAHSPRSSAFILSISKVVAVRGVLRVISSCGWALLRLRRIGGSTYLRRVEVVPTRARPSQT